MQAEQQQHRCHLCNSPNYSLLYNRGKHDKTVHNYICEQCGFIFVLPRPNLDELKTFYKQNQRLINEREFRQRERIARLRLQLLESRIGQELWTQEQKSVLEIGCGTGSFLRLMRACGWNVLGLEPDVAFATSHRYQIPVKNQFVEEFHSSQVFDLVCSQSIAQIADPNLFLESIHRLLVSDGHLYLECPSIDYWNGDADAFFGDDQVNTFSQKNLTAFLTKSGFQTVSSGWNVSSIWAIAKKTKAEDKFTTDNPKRLRHLVNLATSKDRLVPAPLAKIRIQLNRHLNIVKNHPSEVKLKVQEQISQLQPLSALNYASTSASKVAVKPTAEQKTQLKIVHLGLHFNGNAGDTLLFPAVRWLLQKQLAPAQFTLLPLHAQVTQETIDKINQQDALLIGGGGVLLADTNPNNASGWQWACPMELLEQIKVPIIVFAIGYNRFRGQQEFAPIFKKSISKLIEKSIFFGLRNRGSIEALKGYLPAELHSKISFQPCPTTILNRFYPNLPAREEQQPTLAVNIAFDRHTLRFGEYEDEILWGIAEALLLLQQQGWKIKLFTHTKEDKDAHYWFRAKGLFAEEVSLWGVPTEIILAEYSKVSMAVGMRGHAQMVPFGLGCPILSLISHDKLRFFLEDIGHPEWGLDVKTPRLKERLVEKINGLYENRESLQLSLLEAQEKLWRTTQENAEAIRNSELISHRF